MEAKLVTLALVANLNGEPESEVVKFFKSLKGECTRDQAMKAISDAKKLAETVKSVLTVGAIYSLVKKHLEDQERQRIEEEAEWNTVSPTAPDLLNDSEETELGIIASQLPPGQFLVRAKVDWAARDSHKEHSLSCGDVFIIDQTADDWYCGHRIGQSLRDQKWIYSQYVVKIFS
jgi:hypothetical protein